MTATPSPHRSAPLSAAVEASTDWRPAAALTGRRVCPYLAAENRSWRLAQPSRDHRCGAVEPPALLALDKQRRLCLTDEHRACATFIAATENAPYAADGDRVGATRWSIVRTMPLVLDHGRTPAAVAPLIRGRAASQVGLGLLMVVAVVAIIVSRLPGNQGESPVGVVATASPSSSAVAARSPSPTASAAPSPSPAALPSPSVTVSASPVPTPTPVATPGPPATRAYRVKSGDTLYDIAARFGTTVKQLQRLNGLSGTTLHIGQVIKVPA